MFWAWGLRSLVGGLGSRGRGSEFRVLGGVFEAGGVRLRFEVRGAGLRAWDAGVGGYIVLICLGRKTCLGWSVVHSKRLMPWILLPGVFMVLSQHAPNSGGEHGIIQRQSLGRL